MNLINSIILLFALYFSFNVITLFIPNSIYHATKGLYGRDTTKNLLIQMIICFVLWSILFYLML